jgi:phosphoribosylanthranilate isomerase
LHALNLNFLQNRLILTFCERVNDNNGETPMENAPIPSCSPQVKICGLTRIDEAVACAALGADAIGFVFYSKSPRRVTAGQAREISMALPPFVCRVGVFVNETFDTIMQVARDARLQAVQLHGMEPPGLVKKIAGQGLTVIKALFSHREPFFTQAAHFPAAAFLLECGLGPLPGGNARTWDVSLSKQFKKGAPFILAGGLASDNVVRTIDECQPDSVDVSSGVESRPGRKDLNSVKQFMAATRKTHLARPSRRIFYGHNG